MSANARSDRIGDVLEWVCRSCVFRQAGVVIVRNVAILQNDVLQYRAAADGIPNFRLAIRTQLYALGVATALDVEHSLVGPTVLVVSNQAALGVGGKGGLSGSTESKEKRGVAIRSDVGGAVHAHDALLWQ